MIITVSVITCGTVAYAAQEDVQGVSGQESEHVLSESKTTGRVRSSGSIRYEYAVIDAYDLQKIDAHISEKKDAAARALIQLGTRFRQQSGEYVYDRNPDSGQEEIDLSGLNWTTLVQAAGESQNVPAGLSVLNPEAALHIEGVEERTDFYEAASEDNLSAGKAAWVNGRLLLGNGADNDKAYLQGLADGRQGKVLENFSPIYKAQGSSAEIRHVHVGSQEESEGTSGCYYNHFETFTRMVECNAELVYCESKWYPNENEPGGGSWHGDYYTCPYHGGIYDPGGTCTYEETIIGWSHDLACGLENVLYARLTVKVVDAGKQAGTVRLNAVLDKGDGYGRLTWQNGEKLVWTDDKGKIMGKGSVLTVTKPGIYRCSINVSNEDIDRRTTEAVVRVSGLMLSGN